MDLKKCARCRELRLSALALVGSRVFYLGHLARCEKIRLVSMCVEVRDEGMLAILAELAGPRLRELKPYEVLAGCCGRVSGNGKHM